MILEFAKYRQYEYYGLFAKVKKLFQDIASGIGHSNVEEDSKWGSVIDVTLYYESVDGIWLHYNYVDSTFRLGLFNDRFFDVYSYLYHKFNDELDNNGLSNIRSNRNVSTFNLRENDIDISLEDYELFTMLNKYRM